MKKILSALSEWVRSHGHHDTALGHLLQFIYRFFASWPIQAATSTLGTVVIASIFAKAYYGCFFWIAIILYILSTFLIAFANYHISQKIIDTNTFQHALFSLSATMRTSAITLQKCAKHLSGVRTLTQAKQVLRDSNIDFQTIAFAVCEGLKATLSKKAEKDDVYVTVYQKFIKDGNTYCQMIAHSENHEVTGYEIKYPILPEHKNMYGEIEYHTYVFANEIKDITSFHTHDLVMGAFCIHNHHREREEKIQQYVCIPISPAKLGVTFLLQVDTSTANLFGENAAAVSDFAKNIIDPYAQFLHMIYEQSRVIEQIQSK